MENQIDRINAQLIELNRMLEFHKIAMDQGVRLENTVADSFVEFSLSENFNYRNVWSYFEIEPTTTESISKTANGYIYLAGNSNEEKAKAYLKRAERLYDFAADYLEYQQNEKPHQNDRMTEDIRRLGRMRDNVERYARIVRIFSLRKEREKYEDNDYITKKAMADSMIELHKHIRTIENIK